MPRNRAQDSLRPASARAGAPPQQQSRGRPQGGGRPQSAKPDKQQRPVDILKEAEAALETGEKRQRNGELDKARAYYASCVESLERAGLVGDAKGCLLFGSATSSVVELQQEERRAAAFGETIAASRRQADADSSVWIAALQTAASALERGHAAAKAAAATQEELGNLCAARAQAADLLRDELEARYEAGGTAGPAALPEAAAWAAAAAALWEAATEHEAAAKAELGVESAEPEVETLTSRAAARLAVGLLPLKHATVATPEAELRAAEAALARALADYEAACALCDSAGGDDVSEVVGEWAHALWDAATAVQAARAAGAAAPPAHASATLLERAAAKARDALALQPAPRLPSCNLLGDVLRAAAEEGWRHGAWREHAPPAAAAAAEAAGAAGALYARALEAYSAARRVRHADLRTRSNEADACLDASRLQLEAEAAAAAAAAAGSGGGEAGGDFAAPMDTAVEQMAGDMEAMQLDGAAAARSEPPPPPLPLPAELLRAAVAEYRALLARPVGEWVAAGMSAQERADCAFNCACGLALAGQEAECAAELERMEAQGWLHSRAELADDADLAPFAAAAWMQTLLGRLPAT